MNNPKIIFVINASCGGSERVAIIYAKILKANGYNCKFILIDHSSRLDIPIASFIPNDIPYCVIKGRARYTPFKLLREIRLSSPDIIYGSLVPISNLLLMYKTFRLISAKVVVRMNTSPLSITKEESKFAKRLFPKADAVICQTKEMKEELNRYYRLPLNLLTVIYNPIDIELIQEKIKEHNPLDSKFCNYVAVGRIHPIKGYDTLIESFARVCSENNQARLYIVGGCPNETYIQELKDKIKLLGIENYVYFEGFQKNPYKYTWNADVYVLSSLREGLPNVLLEALYLGVPIVATRCVGYIDEVIIHGQNGYIVEPRDVDGLANKMLQAINLNIEPKFKFPYDSTGHIIDLFSSIL